jgi:hypothetical protein
MSSIQCRRSIVGRNGPGEGFEPTTSATLRKTAVVQKQLQKSHYRSTIILFSASRPSYVNNAIFNKSIAMTPEEGNRLALLTGQCFSIKRRLRLKVKNQIYISVFQNQGDQIRDVNVH